MPGGDAVTGCPAPLPLSRAIEYWLGELPAAAEAELDLHLLACADCTRHLTWVAEVARALPEVVRGGRVPLALTTALVAKLEQDGVRIRHHRVAAGGAVRCTAAPGDDLVALWLAGPFRTGERVDLEYLGLPGVPAVRREDVPVDPGRSELVFVEPGDVIRAFPAHVTVVRAYAVAGAGERLIGTYTLHHTPWSA
ncbi:MAG TPA: hypothetical protein VFC42_08330 [Methylomirabilota bacterium]|jgi:hypothetical protein|nr:hypothetical protein [Methylomirabilota bacterium]